MSKVLIAGCGFVGCALGAELKRLGHEPIGLSRSPGDIGFPLVVADLSKPETLRVISDVDAIAFTSAADNFSEAGYRSAYVTALESLLSIFASRSKPPKRIVFTSSTSVYAQNDGAWIDERSPAQPKAFSGSIMLEAEGALHATPIESVTLRCSGIYGPGRTRLIDQVRTGEAKLAAAESPFTNRIHRDDVARAVAHLLFLPNPDSLYVGSDDDPAPRNRVFEWLREQLDAPPLGSSEILGKRGGNKRCRNARLKASGFEFKYKSFRDGYSEMLSRSGP